MWLLFDLKNCNSKENNWVLFYFRLMCYRINDSLILDKKFFGKVILLYQIYSLLRVGIQLKSISFDDIDNYCDIQKETVLIKEILIFYRYWWSEYEKLKIIYLIY